jgi:hypothetical protein
MTVSIRRKLDGFILGAILRFLVKFII